MNNNLKNAFIDQLLLGFFLLAGIIIFIATSSDETITRNKAYDLKNITRDAAHAAGKYYIADAPNYVIADAQAVSVGIVSSMKLGNELIGDGSNSSTSGTTTIYTNPDSSGNSLTYEWDLASNPKTLTVSISPYEEDTFWYRFLKLFKFTLNASHKIELVTAGPEDINDLAPFIMGGCDYTDPSNPIQKTSSDLITTFTLKFGGEKGFENYNQQDRFYGIVSEYDSANGNSNFSHFKNGVKQDYDVDFTVNADGQLVQTGDYWTDPTKTDGDSDFDDIFSIPKVSSEAMEKTNDPKSLYDEVKHFIDTGVTMFIGIAKCENPADSDNITINEFIKVKFTNPPTFVNSADPLDNGYEPLTFDLELVVEPGETKDAS